jgi:hypothetical protein
MSAYSWYNRIDWYIVAIFIGAALVVTGFVIFVRAQARSFEKSQTVRYAECKDKTTDLEWCIKQVYGVDVLR